MVIDSQRVRRLKAALKQAKLDAILLRLPENIVMSFGVWPGQEISSFGPNRTGNTIIRPGGRNCYPAFWVRDYAMSLETGFITTKEQLCCVFVNPPAMS